MAQEIVFLEQPYKVTAASGSQPLFDVVDVGDYDELDLWLGVFSMEGTSPTLQISISTSMDDSNESGWITAATFTTVAASNSWVKLNVQNLLRFVRYNWVLGGSGSPAAAFVLSGMARAWR